MKKLLITIDGPAGAGKTTVSRCLAQRLGYSYVDTGALYRAVALAAQEAGLGPGDDRGLQALCAGMDLRVLSASGGMRLVLGGRDITAAIRTPEISMLASAISARPVVRGCLLELQRALGRRKGVVFEGRDMGTVVFPDADVKFYLDAEIDVRASRRFEELRSAEGVTCAEVAEAMRQLDQNDRTRPVAPLRPAADAVRIDSSARSVEEVVALMLERLRTPAAAHSSEGGHR